MQPTDGTPDLDPSRPLSDGSTPSGGLPSGGLPSGPHPTLGPATRVLPRWPGPLMIVVGVLLALGALSAAQMILQGRLEMDRSILLPTLLVGAALFGAGLVWSAVRQIQQRRVLAPERYRGPTVIVLLALVLLIQTVLVLPWTADAAALFDGDRDLTLLGSIAILSATGISLLLVSWLFVGLPNALAALPAFPGRDPRGALAAGIGWGVLAWIGSTAVIVIVAWLLELVGQPPQPSAAEVAIGELSPWITVPAVVILAPIAEEVFFRGVVFNAWLREGGRAFAYVGSAALFAVIHLSLVSILPIFLLGLALAWIYERTGSLLAPIAMHATVNGISVTIALLARFEILRFPI